MLQFSFRMLHVSFKMLRLSGIMLQFSFKMLHFGFEMLHFSFKMFHFPFPFVSFSFTSAFLLFFLFFLFCLFFLSLFLCRPCFSTSWLGNLARAFGLLLETDRGPRLAQGEDSFTSGLHRQSKVSKKASERRGFKLLCAISEGSTGFNYGTLLCGRRSASFFAVAMCLHFRGVLLLEVHSNNPAQSGLVKGWVSGSLSSGSAPWNPHGVSSELSFCRDSHSLR